MSIEIKTRKEPTTHAELKGLEKMISLSDLEAKVLTSLPWPDRDLAQKLFEEIFTTDNLSRRADSNLARFLFQKLLELSAPRYGVSPEHVIGFLKTVDPLWKRR